ncbi:MAG: hypothetical protein ILO36_00320, partial [Abditibacteriota bacterium]|nr:hypothetical protein [Abditibacteriota bacterium]
MKMVFALFAFVLLLCSFPLFAGEGFTGRFSDFSSAEKWRNSALSGDVPPVSFLLDGKPSSSLRWIKGKEEEARYTDFALSGEPAERLSRSADWVCPSEQLMLRVTESRYPGFPVAEYDARLVNLSDGPSKTVSDIRSLDASVMKGGADAHYNRGTTIPCSAIEYEPFCVRVEKGKDLEVRTVTGLPTQDYLPFFNFAGKKGGVIAAVNWQGSWSMKASVSDGCLRLAAGQGETRLALLPREELRLPGTVLMFYKGSDWQEGQNLWRRWIVRHNLFRHTQKRFTELVYLASPLNQSLEADLAAIDSPFVKEI